MMSPEQKLDSLIREVAEFRISYQKDQAKDAETLGMMYKELNELTSAVRGNERNDQPGLIGRLKVVEHDVKQVKGQQYKIVTWAITLAAAANVLWIVIKEWFSRG